MKRRIYLLIALLAMISSGAWALTDVTSSYLTDAAIENESNWGGGNSVGGNHSKKNGYWESWHNTFSLTQTTAVLPAGYYRLSIQAVNSALGNKNASLTATTETSTETAYIKNSSAGSFDDITGYFNTDTDLDRIYVTVQVKEGEKLTATFAQTDANEWIVYGLFKLEQLTDAEGENEIALQDAIGNLTSWEPTNSTNKYLFGYERYSETAYESGEILYNTFTGVPKGNYEIQVYAVTNMAWKDFPTGDDIAQLYTNTKTYPITVIRQTGCNIFDYPYTLKAEVEEDGGTLTYGIKNIATGGNWYILITKSITYLGEDLLAAYKTQLNNAVIAAKAIDQDKKMNADVKSALQSAITNNDGKTYSTAEEYSTAIEAVTTATSAASTSIAAYAKVGAEIVKADGLDAAGKAKFAELAGTIVTNYNNGTILDNDCNDVVTTLIADLATSAKAQTTPGSDMTLAIANYDFLGCTSGNFPGWTIEAPNGGNRNPLGNTAVEYWNGTAANGQFDYYQTVTGLPSGRYTLTAKMWNSMNGVVGEFAATSGVYGSTSTSEVQKAVGTDCDDSGMVEQTTDQIVVSDGTLRLGVKNFTTMVARWFGVDYIHLTFASALSDKDAAVIDLQALYDNAKTYSDANKKMSTTAAGNLVSELATANTVLENEASKSLEEIVAAKNSLNEKYTAAQASETAYSDINAALEKYAAKVTSLNTTGQAAYDVSAISTGYTNGTIEGDGTTEIDAIKTAFAVAAVAQGPGSDITCLLENPSFEEGTIGWSVTRNTTGQWNYGPKGDDTESDPDHVKDGSKVLDVWSPQIDWINVKQTVKLPAGTYVMTAGVYVNGAQNQQRIYLSDGKDSAFPQVNNQWNLLTSPAVQLDAPADVNIGIYSKGKNQGGNSDGWFRADNFKLYVANAVDMVITDAKYATFCAPFDVTIPDGVTASQVTGVNENTLILEPVATTIPANTPVVLQSDDAVNKKVFGHAVTGTPTAGLLTGVYTDTPAPVGSYVLQNLSSKVSFYQVAADNQPTVKANHAYLTVSSGAKEFFLDEATGVSHVENAGNVENVGNIYNLAGQVVDKNYKGIVIVNGKKMLNK